MKPRFADSGYFIALLNAGDSLHREALRLHSDGNNRIVTTEWVLTEVAAAFSNPLNRHLFETLHRSLSRGRGVTMIESDPVLWHRGCDLYFSRPDKGWSLTDCISCVVMQDMGLEEALTPDHHFDQMGFVVLMKV